LLDFPDALIAPIATMPNCWPVVPADGKEAHWLVTCSKSPDGAGWRLRPAVASRWSGTSSIACFDELWLFCSSRCSAIPRHQRR
jgi:hypothetical protein